MSLQNIINNLDFAATPSQFIYDQHGQLIEVRYVGNHTDPQTQLSYVVYATNDRTPILVPQPLAPQPLAPHQYPLFHPQPYQDDHPADQSPRHQSPRHQSPRHQSPRHQSPRHQSPRHQSPLHQRQRNSRQESARQRRLTRRAARREAMDRFMQNQAQIMFANPNSIFNPQLPPAPMDRPESPVRQQAPNPNSHRSRRKASRQQRDERAASGRIYGGAKTKRRCRRY
jgi:hypothetical protein